MIDLEVLATEDFRYGPLGAASNTETLISLVAQTKEVETARRTVEKEDFKKIEDFAESLLKEHYHKAVHFDYDITLVALAIILVESDGDFPEKFLAELENLYNQKKAPELFWSRKVAANLVKLKKNLEKIKIKVRRHFSDAIFLPIDELGLVFDPPARLAGTKVETRLIIAVAPKDNLLNIVDHKGKVVELSKETVLSEKPDAIFNKPYLTDYGQTLGFGGYNECEFQADWVFAQAKVTA